MSPQEKAKADLLNNGYIHISNTNNINLSQNFFYLEKPSNLSKKQISGINDIVCKEIENCYSIYIEEIKEVLSDLETINVDEFDAWLYDHNDLFFQANMFVGVSVNTMRFDNEQYSDYSDYEMYKEWAKKFDISEISKLSDMYKIDEDKYLYFTVSDDIIYSQCLFEANLYGKIDEKGHASEYAIVDEDGNTHPFTNSEEYKNISDTLSVN